MSIKYEHDISHSNILAKCICVRHVKNSLVLASDEINYTEKMFIEEYPESNFNIFYSLS